MKRVKGFIFCLMFAVLGAAFPASPGPALPDTAAPEASLELCLKYIQSHPDSFPAYEQIGFLYARQNDLTNAERYFRKAVRVNRLYSRGYFNLGVLKLNAGDYNAALENFIIAVTFATDDVQGLVNIGNIFNIRNDLNNAFYYYQKAFKLNMNDADLQNNLGVLALKRKNYAEAVGFLAKAWAAGKDEDIQLNLGIAYYYLDEKAKIRELYPHVNPQLKHYSTIIQLLGR